MNECALNPAVAHEAADHSLPKDGNGRKVIVIGAGVSGLKAAEVLARREFSVTVLEKGKKAGGQVVTASACNLKDKLYWCVEDLMRSVQKLGVDVQLGTEATEESILAMAPYAVVVATGGKPIIPGNIKGSNLPHVVTAPDIIMKRKRIKNKNVVVIGSGMTGLETTEILNEGGNHVTVIEMADEIAPGTLNQLIEDEMDRIAPYHTVFKTGTRLMKITEDSIIVEDVHSANLETIPADNVVLSMGVRPVNELAGKLANKMEYVITVGDAVSSGTIADAVHSAYDAVAQIH